MPGRAISHSAIVLPRRKPLLDLDLRICMGLPPLAMGIIGFERPKKLFGLSKNGAQEVLLEGHELVQLGLFCVQ